MHERPDVLVAGAGPVGCVAALAHARRGATVWLVDPSAEVGDRFAGELLHPAAVDVLRGLGAGSALESAHATRGFHVVAGDGADQVSLDYAGAPGRTFAFPELLGRLRAIAASTPGIRFLPRQRVVEVDRQEVTLEVREGAGVATRRVLTGRLVVADGRFSALRRHVRDGRAEPLSAMAGLVLRGVELPQEGRGHVFLGPVGPALAYRIGPDAVRVCLDVPSPWKRSPRREELLAEAYGRVLPPALARAVREELECGRVAWAVNALLARTAYAAGSVALVGDAAGHVHPMTAVGMTLGFGDAAELARHDDLARYATVRRRATRVPELLASALYEIFSLPGAPTAACRAAVLDMWRGRPALRRRTMALLACEDTRMAELLTVGSELVARASRKVVAAGPARGVAGDVARIGGLIHWLLDESVPPPMRVSWLRAPVTPFAPLRRARTDQLRLLAEEGA